MPNHCGPQYWGWYQNRYLRYWNSIMSWKRYSCFKVKGLFLRVVSINWRIDISRTKRSKGKILASCSIAYTDAYFSTTYRLIPNINKKGSRYCDRAKKISRNCRKYAFWDPRDDPDHFKSFLLVISFNQVFWETLFEIVKLISSKLKKSPKILFFSFQSNDKFSFS